MKIFSFFIILLYVTLPSIAQKNAVVDFVQKHHFSGTVMQTNKGKIVFPHAYGSANETFQVKNTFVMCHFTA